MSTNTSSSHRGRTILISLAILILLLIIVGVTGIFSLQSQWFLNFAETKLTRAIGQEVTLGSIDIDPGQPVYVRVENISVANPSWASTPFLATIDAVEAGIDVVELLSGDFVFTEIRTTELLVHLEQSADGKANWRTQDDSANGGGTSDEKRNEENVFDLPRIESLAVKDGLVTYNDAAQNTSLRVALHTPDGTNRSSTGLIADGDGTLFGHPLQIELETGPSLELTVTDATGYPLTVRLHSVDTGLLIEGKVDALVSPEAATLQVKLKGQNLSRWNESVKMALPALPAYELTGHLLYADGVWALKPGTFTVEDNHITGSLQIVPDTNPPRIKGQLYSKRLNVPQIQSYLPHQPEKPLAVKAAQFLHFLETTNWQAELSYHADLITTGTLPVHNAEVILTLKDKILTVEKLSGAAAGMTMKADGRISAGQEPAEGRIQVQFVTAEVAGQGTATEAGPTEINAISELPGRLTGEVAVRMKGTIVPLEGKADPVAGQDPEQRVQITSIDVPDFHIRYTDSSTNTDILMRLNQEKIEKATILKADGQFHNKPIQVLLKLPELDQLTDPDFNSDRPQQIAANLHLPGTMASLVASVIPAWPPASMDVRFLAESPNPAMTAKLFGADLPQLDQAVIKGSLANRNNMWTLKHIKGRVGQQSTVQGEAIIDTANKIRFEAKLHSDLLDIASLIPKNDEDDSLLIQNSLDDPPSVAAGHIPQDFSIPQWLTNINGKIGFDVQKLVLPNASLKDVTLMAVLDDGRLRIAPLSLEIGRGIIRTTAMVNLTAPALAGSLQMVIEKVDLDKALQEMGREATELGKINGHLALHLPAADPPAEDTLTTDRLLERVRLEEVRLQYDDPALQTKTDLRLQAESLTSGMTIKGTVEYRDRPVEVSLSTGSLSQAFKDYKSMPVHAVLKVEKTTLGIEGKVEHLFPLENLAANLTLEGPNPARLGEWLDIPLPHLPPYRIQTQLHREQTLGTEQTYILKELNGTIGDSDIGGRLRITTGEERPMVVAQLRSRKLDLDDLGSIIGKPPDPEETASQEQKARAEAQKDSSLLLPDEPINFTKLLKLNANVSYQANHVQAHDLPLNHFKIDLTLEDGHLQIAPLNFGVGDGVVTMELEIEAGEAPVQAKLNADFDQVNLSKLLAQVEVADDAVGNIGGHATLWMHGETLADWFASADGGLYLTMTGGKLDSLLVELAGLDFIESAAVFLGTESTVSIDCAYTDLQARSGIVTIQPLLIDTKDTKFKGFGTIDLRHERIDMTVRPYPQDFSLLSSRGPLHVTGTFKNSRFGVEPSFPLPEFGTADTSERCVGMIEALRTARKHRTDDSPIHFEPGK